MDINQVKEFLKDEPKITLQNIIDLIRMSDGRSLNTSAKFVFPILHNTYIILQFNGWSINLYPDGTWLWEATDGG